jgi:hypothetical protein
MVTFPQTKNSKYHKGWIPIPDTTWIVEVVDSGAVLGQVIVSGELVGEEMDKHESIKGFEPCDIALKLAHKQFPNKHVAVFRKFK